MAAQEGSIQAGALALGTAVVIFGPLDFTDDVGPWEAVVRVAGRGTTPDFRLVLEFYDGTNWVTVKEAADAVLTQAVDVAGTETHPATPYTNVAELIADVSNRTRVLLENLSGANALTYSADARLKRA